MTPTPTPFGVAVGGKAPTKIAVMVDFIAYGPQTMFYENFKSGAFHMILCLFPNPFWGVFGVNAPIATRQQSISEIGI